MYYQCILECIGDKQLYGGSDCVHWRLNWMSEPTVGTMARALVLPRNVCSSSAPRCGAQQFQVVIELLGLETLRS